MSESDPCLEVSPEHLRYAVILEYGVWAALFVLATSYLAYLAGWATPLVPLDQVQQHWGLSHDAFVAATGMPVKWRWLTQLQHPDMANLLGIAMLGLLSCAGLLGVLPVFWRRKDKAFCTAIILELAVVLLAASGVITRGH